MGYAKKTKHVQFRISEDTNDLIETNMLLERREKADYCRLVFEDALDKKKELDWEQIRTDFYEDAVMTVKDRVYIKKNFTPDMVIAWFKNLKLQGK